MEKREYEVPEIVIVGELAADTQSTHHGIIYDGGPLPVPHQTLAQAGSAS
jgi:hypothetical protein